MANNYSRIILEPELEKLLKEKKALTKFKKNTLVHNKGYFKRHKLIYNCASILFAFEWKYTQEGSDFWERLNNLYQAQLEKLLNN